MKDKTRSTKLIHSVYSAESEQLLAKGEDFFFTYDYVKASTLYWNIIKDEQDMTAATAGICKSLKSLHK